MSTIPTGDAWAGFAPPPAEPGFYPPEVPVPPPGWEQPGINEASGITLDSEGLPVLDDPIEVAVEDDEPEPQVEPEPVPEPDAFPDEVKEDFTGLMYVGALTDEFDFVGHRIRIRTLTDDEELLCGVVAKPWANTVSEIKALQMATVAACITHLDGQPFYRPLGPNEDTPLHRIEWAFAYVRQNWYPVTIDAIYERFRILGGRVRTVVEAMGKASG